MQSWGNVLAPRSPLEPKPLVDSSLSTNTAARQSCLDDLLASVCISPDITRLSCLGIIAGELFDCDATGHNLMLTACSSLRIELILPAASAEWVSWHPAPLKELLVQEIRWSSCKWSHMHSFIDLNHSPTTLHSARPGQKNTVDIEVLTAPIIQRDGRVVDGGQLIRQSARLRLSIDETTF